MALTKETRLVVRIMSHRLYYSLQAALLDEPTTAPQFARVLNGASNAAAVEFESRPLLFDLLRSAKPESIRKLFEPLPDTTWVQLVEDLLGNERCTLNYFGHFEVKDDKGRPSVYFRPVGSFLRAAPAIVEASDDRLETSLMGLCQDALRDAADSSNQGRGSTLDDAYTMAADAFRSALPAILTAVEPLSQPSREMNQDPFMFVPRALAHGAYYLSTWSVSQVLQRAGRISVIPVGELRHSNDTLTFTSHPQLLGMLSAMAHS